MLPRIHVKVLQVRTERAEGFEQRGVVAKTHRNVGAPTLPILLPTTAHDGHAGEHRRTQLPLQHLLIFETPIQVVEQEGQTEAQDQPHHQAQDGVAHRLGSKGRGGSSGPLHDGEAAVLHRFQDAQALVFLLQHKPVLRGQLVDRQSVQLLFHEFPGRGHCGPIVLLPEEDELLHVGVGHVRRLLGVGAHHLEPDDVGVRLGLDRHHAAQPVDREVISCLGGHCGGNGLGLHQVGAGLNLTSLVWIGEDL